MDAPFIYDSYVTGKNFIGRKSECNALSNLLSANENVAIYEPPKTGKKSVVHQTLYNMRFSGNLYNVVNFNMMSVRTIADFLVGFCDAVIRGMAAAPQEYSDMISKYLDGTHFIFDEDRFSTFDEIVSLSGETDKDDIFAILRLPAKLVKDFGVKIIIVLEEFQSILFCDGYETLLKSMEAVLAENKEIVRGCPIIFCGSKVNAMKFIFEERRYFYRLVEHLPLNLIEENDIADHIMKGFLTGGKVIGRDQAAEVCVMLNNNIWHINHFSAICDYLSKGYITNSTMNDALEVLIATMEPKYMEMTDNLTDHQLSLLKAVLDGVTKFSSTEIIEAYSLNSSANVRRVKDALKKKEILTFNEKDEPVILDPLYRYWIAKRYFAANHKE